MGRTIWDALSTDEIEGIDDVAGVASMRRMLQSINPQAQLAEWPVLADDANVVARGSKRGRAAALGEKASPAAPASRRPRRSAEWESERE
jgi:hypothetical protein